MAAVAVLACYSGTRRQKASRFGGMAPDDGVRAWFNLRVPKTRWPALLKIRSLCSAVAKGKGDDLIRFLDDAYAEKQVAVDPEERWLVQCCDHRHRR